MPNKNRLKNSLLYNRRIAHYNHEHDDRAPLTTDSTRRVSFKNYGNNRNKNFRQRGRDEKMRAALAIHDEDVEMMIGCSYSHNRGRRGYPTGSFSRRGRGLPRRDSPNPMRKLPESPVQWYKVCVPDGQKYEKDYLVGLIQSYIKPLEFIPVGMKLESNQIMFFVDDFKVAQQILMADKRITTNDNWRLSISVRGLVPVVDITDNLKAHMKLAMSTRYNTANKSLDLTRFHLDPVFLKDDIFCPLNRTNVLLTVLQIIGDSIPDLLALNIESNRLVAIDGLKKLKTCTSGLKILHMGKNNVRFIDQFDSMQGLQIEELELDGNPLCDKFRDKDTYIREVQKRFPKVIKLDGTDVPRLITFEVEEAIPLVPSRGSFLCDPAAANVIRPFLQQYYNLYDSETRAPLVDAYHQDAQFSLSCSHQSAGTNSMAPYLQDSRNLLLVNNADKRKRLLRRGKTNIVAFLTTLPKTQHDPSTLTVDCSIFTPSIIILSVTGVFREVTDKKYPLRSFHRSFVIVPFNTGFCIINEMLHISAASPEQVKSAFKVAEAAPAAPLVVPQVASPVVPIVAPVVAPAIPLDIATRQQMVTTFAAQSGMNLIWSEKCLNENNWDYNHSLFIFTELQKQGNIPQEAFIK